MDKAKWLSLTKPQQMGNIGSEIARADYWQKQGDSINTKRALERALELLDLTLDDQRWKIGLKEIARLREVLACWFCGGKFFDVSPAALKDYCLSFVLKEKVSF